MEAGRRDVYGNPKNRAGRQDDARLRGKCFFVTVSKNEGENNRRRKRKKREFRRRKIRIEGHRREGGKEREDEGGIGGKNGSGERGKAGKKERRELSEGGSGWVRSTKRLC